MNTRLFQQFWFRVIIVGITLLLPLASHTATLQEIAPENSQAQVVAQGVQAVDSAQVRWQVETVRAAPTSQSISPSMAFGGFVYATADPLIVHRDFQDFRLVSRGEATWTPYGLPTQVITAGETQTDFSIISLEPESEPAAGEAFGAFSIDPGSYNVRFMRGALHSGDEDTFAAVNDMPWLLIVTSGDISLDTEMYTAGDLITGTGDVTLGATDSASATYLIASIGSQVTLPVAPLSDQATFGEVQVQYFDCNEADFPVETTEQCKLNREPVQSSFTRFSQGTPLTRTDGEQLPDGSWIFEEMLTGDWDFQLTTTDGTTPPIYTVFGDMTETDTGWIVNVRDGERSSASVLIYSDPDLDQGINLSTLTVHYLECPSGWMESMDLQGCSVAQNIPTLEIRDVRGAGVVLNTDRDAVTSDPGTFTFQNIPPETYLLSLAFSGDWTADNTYFMGSAYTDGLDWYVDVPADDSIPQIYVVLSLEGNTPPTVATGYVVITQDECDSWDAQSSCVPAIEPWEIRLTNIDTGEVWYMSEWSYFAESGVWIMQVPTGAYTVDLPNTGGWQVEFPGWIEVLNDQETPVYIRGNPQP